MYKQSPSRNQRSKGTKVTRVLQICVLLAICFWLIYQVKHSYDKKKAYDESESTNSRKTHVNDEIVKFGRKDLHPRFEEATINNEEHDEDEAEEDETGGGGEDKQLEVEEQEEDKKTEEKEDEDEDEARGGGDDEIDERDQVKTEMDVEGEEDFIDEDKDERDAEEKDAEDKGQNENENSSEDHDRDGGSRNAHEAREEQYKADDASSAVTHESKGISSESERERSENSNQNTDTNMRDEENKVNNTEEITVGQNTTGLRAIVTGKEEKGYEKVETNSTEGQSGTNDLPSREGSEAQDAIVQATTSADLNLQTREENNSYVDSNTNLSNSNLVIPGNTGNTEIAEAASGKNSDSSKTSEGNSNGTQNEKSETGNITDENSDLYSKTDNADEVRHDPIDSSDSSMSLENDVRTDLDTLPEIRTEGTNDEEAAAE